MRSSLLVAAVLLCACAAEEETTPASGATTGGGGEPATTTGPTGGQGAGGSGGSSSEAPFPIPDWPMGTPEDHGLDSAGLEEAAAVASELGALGDRERIDVRLEDLEQRQRPVVSAGVVVRDRSVE